MLITIDRLTGDGVAFRASPNTRGTFGPALPDTIVIHYTAGASLESSVATLCDPRTSASAHLVIGRDGAIVQLVPFDTIASHAGRSSHDGRHGFNKFAIGIEIDNAGRLEKAGSQYLSWFGRTYSGEDVIEAVHRNQTEAAFWHRYTEVQITLVEEICRLLISAYGIGWILGHEEISPGRKIDPGPAFPLDKLRARLFGPARAEDAPADPPARPRAGRVDVDRLNIRAEPSLAAPAVAPPLPRGTVVDILAESSGWSEVDVRIHGWVKSEFLKTDSG